MHKISAVSPRLPRLLSVPLALLPGAVHTRALVVALNTLLAEPLREGVLEFLADRCVAVELLDAGFVWSLTLQHGRLCATSADRQPDLRISASVYDFLCLAGRQVDPDTLVFQRRLLMQGDTELGVQVKNCLDSLDSESLWLYGPLEALLQRTLPVYRNLFT
ncbi:MAG: SCP2 sterol-binding domain-containing protein [Thiogranum sp.]|nr:SCP2 sterol-binding domain-containing protein [Thiogranum sp.]